MLVIVIVSFWLFFGIVVSIFNANQSIEYKSMMQDLQSNKSMNLIEFYNLVLGMFKFLWQSLTLQIPGCPLPLAIFVQVLEIMSALIIVFLILEDLANILTALGKVIGGLGGL